MSVDLGSAHGSLVIDSQGVARGVQQAEAALAQFEARAARSAQALGQVERAGSGFGGGLARGTQGAAQALSQVERAAGQAGRAAEQMGQAGQRGGQAVAQGGQQADAALQQTARSAASTEAALAKVSNVALGIGGVLTAALGVAIKQGADFEHQVAAIGAVADASAEDLDKLRSLAIALGKDVTLAGVSAKDAASAMEALSKAGVSVQDQLAGAAKGALLLASAGGMKDFGQAAEIAANAMALFNLQGKDIPHIADLFAAAANASTIEVTDLARALSQGGQVAAQFGQSIEETTAVLAAFGQAGLKSSDAGTSLKTMLLSLANPTGQAKALMEQYGLAFFDAEGRMKSFTDIAGILHDRLAGLSDQQRAATLATIFGTDAIRAASILYKEGADGIKRWTGEVDKAGSAAAVGAKRNDTLKGSLEQLTGTLEAAQIQASRFVLPDLKRAADGAAEFVNAFTALPEGLQKAAIYGTAAAAGFALVAGAALKVRGAFSDLREMGEAVIGMFVRKEAAKKSLTRANTTLAGSVNNTGFALTKLGGVTAIAVAGLLAADGAARVLTEQSLFGLIASVIQYGDAWGKGRDEAKATFDATRGDLTALQFAIDQTVAKIDDLKAHADDPSVKSILRGLVSGLIQGPVETAKNPPPDPELENQIAKLRTLRYLQAGFLVDNHGNVVTGQTRNVQTGAVTDLAAKGNEALVAQQALSDATETLSRSYRDNADAARIAAQGGLDVWQSAQQAADAFNEAAGANDTLSRSYRENAAAGQQLDETNRRLAISAQMAQQFQDNAAAMQQVSSASGTYRAALDAINQKRAAGLPLTGSEVALLGQLPGLLAGAAQQYQDLAIRQADVLIQQQQFSGSTNAASGAFNALGGTAGALEGKLRALQAAAIDLNSAFGALGQQNSQLASYYNVLQDRIDVLNAKKKESGSLTAAEAAEYDRLTAAQATLGQQMGDNAAHMRDIAVAAAQNADATAKTADQYRALADGLAHVNPDMGQAADGLVGMTDGLGNVAQKGSEAKKAADDAAASAKASGDAAATAAQQFNDYSKAAGSVPTEVTTLVDTPGLNEARIGVDLLSGAIGNLPKSFSITANVDISGAVSQIESLNRMMPHSPAEEGPFRELPNWDALFDIKPAAMRGADDLRAGLTLMRAAIDTGLSAEEQDAQKKQAEVVQAIANAVKAAEDALAGLVHFKPPPAGAGEGLVAALHPIVQAFIVESQRFLDDSGAFDADLLDAGGKVAQTAQSAANALKAGLDALSSVSDFTAPPQAKVDALVAAIVAIVERIEEVASLLGSDGVQDAADFSENAAKIVALLRPAAEGMTALTEFKVPSDEQLLFWGERLLRVIVRIGEIGNLLEVEGVQDAAAFSDDATRIVSLLRPGAEGFTALTDFKVPSDQQIRVFGERLLRVIVRIGEIGSLLETDGVKRAGEFSDAASKVVGILNSASGFNAIAELEPPSDAQLETFVHQTILVVQRIEEAASHISQEGVKAAGDYGENASKAVGLIGTAVGAFRDLKDFVAPSQQAIDSVIAVSQVATNRLIALARQYDKGTLDQLGAFADATGRAFGALSSAMSAGQAITDSTDAPLPADAINTVLGRYQDALGPLRALATVAAEYQTLSAGIRTDLTQAFGNLGASLAGVPSGPGGNPQALGVVAGATVVQRSEVTVTLQMPADDGSFVARSLRIDGKSRHEVADLIAGEIANGAPVNAAA